VPRVLVAPPIPRGNSTLQVVRFGAWYPLQDAGDLAPEGEGVLQLKLATGLHDYPHGKSAMVWYQHARALRTAAKALAVRFADRDLMCRHLIEVDGPVDLEAFCAKLREDFQRRFGSVPTFEAA
jgi:hypothetical protein